LVDPAIQAAAQRPGQVVVLDALGGVEDEFIRIRK